jgi:hypothetical protein
MTNKIDLEDYEFSIAAKRVSDMFDGVGITNSQTWRISLLEAHLSAAVGAPLSIIIHVMLLLASGLTLKLETAFIFASASWPAFFYVSVGRQYLFRRIFERWGIQLDPINLYKKITRLI